MSNNNVFYQTLGLEPSATKDDVKKAYRRLARLTHPDKNPNRVVGATQQFIRIGNAYSELMKSFADTAADKPRNSNMEERSQSVVSEPLFHKELFDTYKFDPNVMKKLYPAMEMHFFALVAAIDVLKQIQIPEGMTLPQLLEITKRTLQSPATVIDDPRYTDTIDKLILDACDAYYNEITNLGLRDEVNDQTIEQLMYGKTLRYTTTKEYNGITDIGLKFPVIIGSTIDEHKQILSSFKEVAKLYKPFFYNVSIGGSSKKYKKRRTRRPRHKSTKRRVSLRHRRTSRK